MFKDKYDLTQAVLAGQKTMTRRLVSKKVINNSKVYVQLIYAKDNIDDLRREYIKRTSPYKIGEVIAITQSYRQLEKEIEKQGLPLDIKREKRICAGYTNKMFVRAEDMPHHIKITNIRVESLQDISDEDCLREGVVKNTIGYYVEGLRCKNWEKESHIEMENGETIKLFPTPREAFAALIDYVSGKGTWDSNPLVWVYEFELVDSQ